MTNSTTPKTPRGPTAPTTFVAKPKPGVELPIRMIETTHASTVLRHIGASLYTVERVGVKEGIALAKTVDVEVLGTQPAAEGEPT